MFLFFSFILSTKENPDENNVVKIAESIIKKYKNVCILPLELQIARIGKSILFI